MIIISSLVDGDGSASWLCITAWGQLGCIVVDTGWWSITLPTLRLVLGASEDVFASLSYYLTEIIGVQAVVILLCEAMDPLGCLHGSSLGMSK